MSMKHRFYRMWCVNTIALVLTAGVSLATACLAFTHWFALPRLASESRPSIPSFDDAFFVPENAPKEEPEEERGMPSQDQLNAALPDAWVLFNGVMKDLKAGRISRECAAERARTFARKAEREEIDMLYDEFSDHYCQNGESKALAFLLRQAAEKICSKETLLALPQNSLKNRNRTSRTLRTWREIYFEVLQLPPRNRTDVP